MQRDQDLSLITLIQIFRSRIKLFWLVFFLSIIVAIAYALLARHLYTAQAVVLTQSVSSSTSSLSSAVMDQLSSLGLGGRAAPLEGILYPNVLESDTAALYVYKKLDLSQYELFKGETTEDRIKALRDRVRIHADSYSRRVIIEATTPDPELSADIVNAFVEALEKLVAQVQASPARRKLAYLEDKLVKVKQELDDVQRKLKEFQETYLLWDVEEQASKLIEEVTELSVEKERLLLSLNTEQKLLGSAGPGDSVQRSRIAAYDDAITRYQEELKRIAGLSGVLADLMREVKVKEAVYTFLITQYEQAKLEEMNEVYVVPVLEYARVPEKRSWPTRKLIAGIGLVAGILGGLFLVFFLEFWNRFREKLREAERESL
ncbi:lipopolysaccharide biosynthesis protein [Spirochaeta thermophila DSM 6578]|uniref:Lipopolysaccharide biosynthesis protein n=1 Tax=Winmispira thermophila (strain ATCC 700085 / DSM 6578 / Z-1203) TaxID=869211 RepID=G0GAX5_WINT7|nr:GNVR domain-containing protein [Spirochaeta thermophila]AEJ61871.1 lipopolysaccharide biosynthesis protein [Spirochaeta thermophila DSM 6578]